MIKLITFDFYNTLVKFWPPLEEIQQGACRKLGLSLPQDALRRGYAQADILFNRANEQEPLSLRSPQRRLEFFAEYEQLILATAGVPVTRDLAKQIWQLAIAVPKEFAPFPDTLPTLRTLREQGYRLGIITNLRSDLPTLNPTRRTSRHPRILHQPPPSPPAPPRPARRRRKTPPRHLPRSPTPRRPTPPRSPAHRRPNPFRRSRRPRHRNASRPPRPRQLAPTHPRLPQNNHPKPTPPTPKIPTPLPTPKPPYTIEPIT